MEAIKSAIGLNKMFSMLLSLLFVLSVAVKALIREIKNIFIASKSFS